MKWQSPGWHPATKTPSAPSTSALITKAGSTLLEQGTWTSLTPSGYFILRLPAISDALNVQNEQAKPTISGFFSIFSSITIPLPVYSHCLQEGAYLITDYRVHVPLQADRGRRARCVAQ